MNKAEIKELLIEQIQDIYDAEKQLVKALPVLAKAAESADLSAALQNHLQETKGHVSRLEEVFSTIGARAKGKTCKGMKGLIEEGNEAVKEQEEGALRDLAIIAGAQRVEHYEIAAYGTVRMLAEELDLQDAVTLLEETENEEKKADETLTNVALSLYDADEEEEAMVEEPATKPATKKGGGAA